MQLQWGALELWHALKADVPLPLVPTPEEKRTLRSLFDNYIIHPNNNNAVFS